MRYDDKRPLSVNYSRSIWIVHNGRNFLEAVYSSPKSLGMSLRLMRVKNPHREYVTDDPNNP